MNTKEHEHTLNVELARLLRKYHGLDARGEQQRRDRRRIDIDVRVGPVRVAIEAEHGRNKKKEAIKDADARLTQGLAECAIALCYPDDSTADRLRNATFLWQVRDRKNHQWDEGDLALLASVTRLTPAQLGNPDAVAASLSDSLDEAVRQLTNKQKESLATVMDLPSEGNELEIAAKRAMLVIATAIIFHSRLDDFMEEPQQDNRRVPPIPFNDEWPPETSQSCTESRDPVASFLVAWNLILALDYKPIFETARIALKAGTASISFTRAVKITARAALAVARNIAGLRHDLLGRIFHTVLNTARYDGSYYTTTSAATMLASLAMPNEKYEHSLSTLKVIDPACGTGTLLMACAQRMYEFIHPKNRKELSKLIIEQVLHGCDVNLTATHMAATTLGLLSPQTQFRNMKISRVLLGIEDGKAYLGSLEFLVQNQMMLPWPNQEYASTQIDSGKEVHLQKNSMDIVIMNPPFTRDSLRHDQFAAKEKKKLKQRERELLGNSPVHLSSNGNNFLFLANYLNKDTDEATLAAVLPLVTATNPSSLPMRKYLAEHYHIEKIITSYDPKRSYFSENTKISEMLLICRRKTQATKPSTQIVKLTVNPDNPSNAITVADEINSNAPTFTSGVIQDWPEELIAQGKWGGGYNFYLHTCAKNLSKFRRGNALKPRYCPISLTSDLPVRLYEEYTSTKLCLLRKTGKHYGTIKQEVFTKPCRGNQMPTS